MMSQRKSLKMHPTGQCPAGQELQINGMTMEQVCAPPNSTSQYLADSQTWVMVPDSWVLVADRATGRFRYEPPPKPKPLDLTGRS
jgi:hypothetical protein